MDAATLKDEVKKTLEINLANASSNPQAYNIMPFKKMLQQDQASMTINVTRDGNTVTVSEPNINPPSVASKYANLPGQIKAFLEKYLEVFPTKRNGDNVDYNNLTVTLEYPGPNVALN